MSYGEYASVASTGASNYETIVTDITGIDFAACWEGPASDKQTTNIKDITDEITNQSSQLNNFSSALNMIDEYDAEKEKYDAAVNALSALDKKSDEYKKTEAYAESVSSETTKRDDAKKKMDELKPKIEELLSSISSTYSTGLSDISQTDLVPTSSIFNDFMKSHGSIIAALDLKTVLKDVTLNGGGLTQDKMYPNFDKTDAWVEKNPYAMSGYTGQCTWFAWGRFYEIYGYDPGFRGDGYQCAGQLLATHPDKFYKSDTPVPGAVFSTNGVTRNHVGIIIAVDGDNITVQDGNYNGSSDSFAVAQNDWGTWTTTLSEFQAKYGGGVIFANPKN